MGNVWEKREGARESGDGGMERRRENPMAFHRKGNFNRLLSGGLDYKLNLRRLASPLFISALPPSAAPLRPLFALAFAWVS